jgi:elongation factor 2
VDSTFGLQIPEDARSNIIAAFLQITRQGVLVNAPMRGIRFDLVDARFHQDSVHRRPNSVVPMASRAMRGGMLMADPTLVEPMYCVNVTGALGTLHSAYSVLGQRGGVIVDTEVTKTTESIRAKLPVRLSFGLAGTLRLATRGHAQVSCHFDGMKMVPVDQQRSIVSEARLSKGLDDGIPEASVFIDRL